MPALLDEPLTTGGARAAGVSEQTIRTWRAPAGCR
jgi:hypothetical protein